MPIDLPSSRSYCDPFSRYLRLLSSEPSSTFFPDSKPQAYRQDQEASAWTRHGIHLMSVGSRDALLEAEVCFEHAIALRESLPLEENPVYRWGLSAGWLNRGDVLTRLGGPERLKKALASYDQALAHLHKLPMQADPRYLWRLALAWVNRGMTLQKLADPALEGVALRHFDTALQVMQGHEASERPDYQQVQAVAWMNRAIALLAQSEPTLEMAELAAGSARRALHYSALCAAGDSAAFEVQLGARHALCRALAYLLESPRASDQADRAESWIHEATDAVETVLGLTRDDEQYQPLRDELFHFGCRIYRAFQPHFLAGYLEEGFDLAARPSVAMRSAADEAIQQALAQMKNEGLASLHDGKLAPLLHTLRELHQTGRKLGLGS